MKRKCSTCTGIVIMRAMSIVAASYMLVYSNAFAIEYDHRNEKSVSRSYDLALEGNDYFKLDVKNTCKSVKIRAIGVTPVTPEKVTVAPAALPSRIATASLSCDWIPKYVKTTANEKLESSCILTPSKVVEVTHDEKNSGYLIKIQVSKNGKPVTGYEEDDWVAVETGTLKSSIDLCEKELKKIVQESGGIASINQTIKDKTVERKFDALQTRVNQKIGVDFGSLKGVALADVDLIVNAKSKKWNTEFSGGVVVSSLTDRRFNVVNVDGGSRITRNSNAEDEQRLILGAFTHVYHSDWTGSIFGTGTPAITAGISVNDGSSLDYFVGPSFKFGSAMINAGYHWGKISKLPGNLQVDQDLRTTVDETRALLSEATNQTQTDRGWYISISFTFAGQGAAPITKQLAFPEPEKK